MCSCMCYVRERALTYASTSRGNPFWSQGHFRSPQFVSLQHPTNHRIALLFIHIPSILIIHPCSPPYFILTFLALRTQSCLRTLRWFKSITLGDRKTLLRCSDWGLLKFISCGIRPEIKKKKKCSTEGRSGVYGCSCVWICLAFMKK